MYKDEKESMHSRIKHVNCIWKHTNDQIHSCIANKQMSELRHLKSLSLMFNIKAIQHGENFYHVRMTNFQDTSESIKGIYLIQYFVFNPQIKHYS